MTDNEIVAKFTHIRYNGIQCTNCRSDYFNIKPKNGSRYVWTDKSHKLIGLYCCVCGKWVKWLSRREYNSFLERNGLNMDDLQTVGTPKKRKRLRPVNKRRYGTRKYVCKDTGESCVGYDNYLNTEHWQLIRSRMITDTSVCSICGKPRRPLQIHHLTYDRVGNELDSDLRLVCAGCHKWIHSSKD